MKSIKISIGIICFLFFSHLSKGQNSTHDNMKVDIGTSMPMAKDASTQEASYKEGAEKLQQKLVKIYKSIHGLEAFVHRVGAIAFTVMPDGTVKEVKIYYALSEKEDEKAVKFIKSTSGKWHPRIEKGIPVEQRIMLPTNNW